MLDDLETGSKQQLEASRVQMTRYHLLSYRAQNFIATGHLKKAEEVLRQAHELASSIKDREVDIIDSFCRATISLAKGSHDTAYEQLQSGINLAKTMNLPDFEWRGHYLLGHLLRRKGHLTAARASYQQAIRIIESLDAYVPENEMKISFLADRYDPYRSMVLLESNEVKNKIAGFGYSETFKAKMLLKHLANTTPAVKDRAQESGGDPSKMLDTIQKQLPQDLVVVEYFMGSAEMLIFMVSAHAFDCVCLPVGRDQITALVNDFLHHIQHKKLAESKRAGRALYKLLILPIQSQLNPQSTLCIIPDDSLSYVPFAALVTEKDRFLVEEYRLAQAPSATLLRWYLDLNKGNVDGKARKVLAIAADERLPEATKEVRAVYEYYKPYSMYLAQPDTGELAFLVNNFEILHFAGHTDLWKDGSPALVFASPRQAANMNDRTAASPPDRSSERVLHSYDVMRWNLSNVRLVNLAACGTGLGKYWHGEGIVGLSYAFLSAGAPALLVSLWKVDGAATRILMERFYANLQRDGMSKTEALRQAQIAMLHSEEPLRSPYYWAPFIVVGDPR